MIRRNKMQDKLLIGLTAFLGFVILYNLYKLLNRQNEDVNAEINEVLNSDKYKVKGRYE
tara:strand:+ start:6050 stop:6226 length:177 start_codon:yes stop_codon:yes gene_type:complete